MILPSPFFPSSSYTTKKKSKEHSPDHRFPPDPRNTVVPFARGPTSIMTARKEFRGMRTREDPRTAAFSPMHSGRFILFFHSTTLDSCFHAFMHEALPDNRSLHYFRFVVPHDQGVVGGFGRQFAPQILCPQTPPARDLRIG